MRSAFRATLVAVMVIGTSEPLPAAQGAEPKPIAEFATDGLQVVQLEFSPDGKHLVVGASEPEPESGPLDSLKIFSSGSYLSYRRPDASFQVWDIEHKKPILSFDREAFRLIAFSSDGKRFACSNAASRQFEIWDLDATPPKVARKIAFDDADAAPSEASLFAMRGFAALSPDGTRFVAATGGETRLWKWDAADDAATSLEVPGAECHQFAFDSTGRRLAFARVVSATNAFLESELEIVICDVTDPKRITRLAGGKFGVLDLRFTSDDTKVEFLTMEDSQRGFLDWSFTRRSVEIATQKVSAGPSRDLSASGFFTGLKTGRTKEGLSVIVGLGDRGVVRLLLEENGRPAGEFTAHTEGTSAMAWSFDGKRLATGGRTEVRVWDVDSLPIRVER